MIFDFFRYITTTYFKPPKPTMERLERRQEEWRRKYMPYATSPASPKPTPPSLPPPTPTRVVKPPSPPITPPRISPPKIPSIHDIVSFSHQIRSELRREGVPTPYYTGKLQKPTPQKFCWSIQYIFGVASKLAERAERKYESVVVQPVLAKVAPEGATPTEQIRRGVAGGLVRTPIALTGIPILRMGFKGVATPSGLKKEFGEMVEYAKKRPFEVGAETATTILAPYAYKKLPVRPTISVAEFPRGRIASLGIEVKKLYGEVTFKPLVSVGKSKIVKPISLGKPKIRGEILSKEAYTPQTPFERGIALELSLIHISEPTRPY